MGTEINLLKEYPKSKRNLDERVSEKSEVVREIARRFDKDFFDGGFAYSPKFWQPVIPSFQKYWQLDSSKSFLDVGCAKGFLIYDLMQLIPGMKLQGIDISKYAIENCKVEVKEYLKIADAKKLPYEDNSFDVVISINTVHNLGKKDCALALQEIERVSRGNSFVTVDAYRNEDEKNRMFAWNLTGKTIMSVEEWIIFFKEIGYTGDYYWFIP